MAMDGYDFTQVDVLRRSMLDHAGILDWNSFMMLLSATAEALMFRVSQAAIAEKYPKYLRVQPYSDLPRAILATPVREEGKDTVPVKYSEKAKTVSIDLSKFFMIEPLNIPRGQRAYIPISSLNGQAMIFHFGEVEFKVIQDGKKNQSNT